jgi:hypothetical protein
VEGNPFSEFAFYHPRALLIYALMAVYWMWSEAEGWKRPEHKAVVEKIVPENLPTQWLWGEAVIPHFLTYIWYRKRVAPSPAHDEMIARVLAEIMANQLQEGVEHLASPYYTVEDVVRHRYQKFLGCDDPLEGEGFERVSYVCEGLLACLVRADLKQKCQELWPNFSRLSHEGLVTEEAWRLGLFRTGDGAINETKIYPRTMQWAGLKAIANEDAAADFPAALRAHPILFLLFVNIFPFRASFSAVKFLHRTGSSSPSRGMGERGSETLLIDLSRADYWVGVSLTAAAEVKEGRIAYGIGRRRPTHPPPR